jgi:hypothetical protein
MPEWRKLHVKITESLDVNDMPDDFTRLLWVLLPLVACSEGRGMDNPSWLRSRTMPLRDDVSIEKVEAAMQWYAQRGMIQRYTVGGRGYFQIVRFAHYQSTQREAESDYPGPSDADDDESATQELVPSNSGVTQELVPSNSVLDVDVDVDIDKEKEIATEKSETDTVKAKTDTRRRAPRPTPPKAGRAKAAEKTTGARDPVPPGVTEFRRQANRYPAKGWYQDIARVVGDDEQAIQRWGEVVHYWVGRGWNPSNVEGMLEFFKRGDMPNSGGDHERSNRDRRNGGSVTPTDAAEQRKRDEAAAERLRQRGVSV